MAHRKPASDGEGATIGIAEAAEMLGKSTTQIRAMLRKGELVGDGDRVLLLSAQIKLKSTWRQPK